MRLGVEILHDGLHWERWSSFPLAFYSTDFLKEALCAAGSGARQKTRGELGRTHYFCSFKFRKGKVFLVTGN